MPMFASTLFENEQQTDQILHLIEELLRDGEADLAAERLEVGLEALEDVGHPIAGFCRAVTVDHIELLGWDRLAQRLSELDARGAAITAIGIDLSCHGDASPDALGHHEPFLETNFYSDQNFPFSACSRNELLAGYETASNGWQGGFEDIDQTIATRGLDELNAAVAELEHACRTGQNDNGIDHDAMLIGSAFMAVRLHQAVKARIMADGLPRAVVVIVGSNESFPFFDAPVITRDEYAKLFPHLEVVAPAVFPFPEPEEFPELEISLDEPQSGSEIRRVLLRQQATSLLESPTLLEEKPVEKPAGMLKRLFARR
jgi:hypothetical protein